VTVPAEKVIRAGARHLEELTGLRLAAVVGFEPAENGWRLQAELVEKESIPHAMDVLGLYDCVLDPKGEVLRFERRGLRRRGDVGTEG
jgi:hypothetical protein